MKIVLLLISTLILFGCSSYKIKGDIQTDFAKKDIPQTEFLPSKDKIAGKPMTILVMDTKVQSKLGKQAELNSVVSSNIEGLLIKNKVNLADRTKATELGKELQLAESKGVSTYQGEQVADYVLIPHITSAVFSRKYHDAYTTQDKEGKTYYHPPRCVYEADTTGFIEVYEMPALVAKDRVEIKGYSSKSTETRRGSSCGYSQDDTNALVVAASQKGIKREKSTIKNLFAPTGYVVEMRMSEKGKAIIKTTLGTEKGAILKGKVLIKQKRSQTNDLTGKTDMIQVTVGEGTISDKLYGPYSWIILNDKKSKLGQIRLGDEVSIEYKDSIFDKMSNGVNSFDKFVN
jgi:hypothetical protein